MHEFEADALGRAGALGIAPVARYDALMRIEVNGESQELPDGTTVTGLLAKLGVSKGPVAVERNTLIVPRAEHATTALSEGDVVEVVQFVGGG